MRKRGIATFAAVLSLGFAVLLGGSANAAGNTCTWVGAGTDAKFSTAANWSCTAGTVPTDGDAIVINGGAAFTSGKTLTNDLTNVNFTSIKVDYTPAAATGVTVNIDKLSLANNGTIDQASNLDSDIYVQIKDLSGVGSVTKNTYMITTGKITIPGTFIANTSYSHNPVDSFGSLSVGAGQDYSLYAGNETDISVPYAINFLGTTASPNNVFISGKSSCPAVYTPTTECSREATSVKFVGQLTLDANVNLTISGKPTSVMATLATKGAGKFVYSAYSEGDMTVNGAKMPYDQKTTDLACDTQKTQFTVARNEVATLKDNSNCSYGSVTIDGVLKGTGKLTGKYGGSLYVSAGGTIAPGNSPGCITTDSLTLAGIYSFEFAGTTACTQHDQLIVTNFKDSQTYSEGDGPLCITETAQLVTAPFANYLAKQGQTFTIIDNQSKFPTVGTFKDLPEGATFEQNGVVFKISYVGGTGNDVTLTVMNQPKAPNTGFETIKANPVVTAAGALLAALAVAFVVRKSQKAQR